MDHDVLLAQLAAMADPSRFHILQLLARGSVATSCERIEAFENGCCVGDVVAETGLSQPTASHHLKALEKVHLVRREVRGPWTCYFPNPEAIEEVAARLRSELLAPAKRVDDSQGDCC